MALGSKPPGLQVQDLYPQLLLMLNSLFLSQAQTGETPLTYPAEILVLLSLYETTK